MHRTFTYLNFALLLALGGTCLFQWRQEHDYDARIADLQRQSDQQQNQLAVQTEDLRRTGEDLDSFKQTVTTLTTQSEQQAAELRTQKAQAFALQNDKDKLDRELDVWKQALEAHKAAVAARDDNIRTLLKQRDDLVVAQQEAAAKANTAIVAYNELAAKYDDVVGRYNALATQYKAEREAATPAPQ